MEGVPGSGQEKLDGAAHILGAGELATLSLNPARSAVDRSPARTYADKRKRLDASTAAMSTSVRAAFHRRQLDDFLPVEPTPASGSRSITCIRSRVRQPSIR